MPYNKGGFVVLLASVFFSFSWFAYVSFFIPPVDLGETSAEALAAGAPPPQLTDSDQNKPWVLSETLTAHGENIYQTYCSLCHGKTGVGDGPGGQGLNPPPRDLIVGEWQIGGSSIQLYKTLIEGIEGTSMVSFSYLSKVDRWALVHYVRSITKNLVKDNPKELEDYATTAP